jgi:hypothetical protein
MTQARKCRESRKSLEEGRIKSNQIESNHPNKPGQIESNFKESGCSHLVKYRVVCNNGHFLTNWNPSEAITDNDLQIQNESNRISLLDSYSRSKLDFT